MEKQSVYITGGAGYVGAMLAPRLLQEGHSVTVLDLMIYGGDVLPVHPNLKVIKGDIRNQELLKSSIPGHDVVIHLACISNDPSFELNPELGKSINLDPFRPMVEISKNAEFEISKNTEKSVKTSRSLPVTRYPFYVLQMPLMSYAMKRSSTLVLSPR